ncbi:MAG: metallophosphoesterase family protein [Bacteroidota bacterium]
MLRWLVALKNQLNCFEGRIEHMVHCCFVSDIHGYNVRYDKLYYHILHQPPDILFIGGDMLPHGYYMNKSEPDDFLHNRMADLFSDLKQKLGDRYPKIFLILGNDDPRINEEKIISLGSQYQIWEYIHNRHVRYGQYDIYGYSFVPPTPFGLKDWEKYDVSRFVDPGCSHPFQGMRTVKPDFDPEHDNIKNDLNLLTDRNDLSSAIFLFHSPPYDTSLDRAALDGKMVDFVPMDVHVGSIAIQRFIDQRQPLLTLHGHVHEASSITGEWMEKMGRTFAFNASYDKKEHLAMVAFDLEDLQNARRIIL